MTTIVKKIDINAVITRVTTIFTTARGSEFQI